MGAIALCAILVTSMICVCMPMFSRKVSALRPDKNMFVVVKAFPSGVILAKGRGTYMHVLPDSFDCLRSEWLPEHPWRKFPFTTFVEMLSAMLTLMVDSFSMSHYRKYLVRVAARGWRGECQKYLSLLKLLRHRVVAQVLELAVVVRSVVIGLSMDASDNPCTIRPLIAALCFHQLFEGLGLGGCIVQVEYGIKTKAIIMFFSATPPLGIVLGIALSNIYCDDSPTALIVVGLLNAGLLNYMALVDLLAADFMGTKLQANVKLQI